MKIQNINIMRGPNFWSTYRQKLIVMTLDIGDYEYYPTNLLDGFTESLVKLIPSIESHRCSLGVKGGFIERLKRGTWLGHVIEHVALEIQSLAGMDCGYGRTRATKTKGV